MAPLYDMDSLRLLSVTASADEATPIGYYTVLISSIVFGFTALPTLVQPWDLGVKIYIPEKLPDDNMARKQMTVLQAMLAYCTLLFVTMSFVALKTSFSSYFVGVMVLFFSLQMITFAPLVFGILGKDSTLYGFDKKRVVPQIVMMFVFLLLLLYSLTTEDYGIYLVDLTLQSKILIGFNVFLILCNAPGVLFPEKMFEMYAPKGQPKDKYCRAQLALYMQSLAIFNTICPLAGTAYLLTTASFGLFITVTVPFYLGFNIFFIYFLTSADEQGWDKAAMQFWLPYNGIVTGCTIILALDAYGMLA